MFPIRRTTNLVVAVLLLTTVFPTMAMGQQTTETRTAFYDVPGGANGNIGGGIATRPCAPEWRNWDSPGPDGDDPVSTTLNLVSRTACPILDPEEDGAIRFGAFSAAFNIEEGDHWTTFHLETHDDNADATYTYYCVTDSSRVCNAANDPDPDPERGIAKSGCGPVSFVFDEAPQFDTRRPFAIPYATYIEQDALDVCIGTSGMGVATLSR